jgi:deoxyribodipyrimidine photo-lyase
MHQEQDWRIGAAYFEPSYWIMMYIPIMDAANSGVGNDPRNRTFNIKSQSDRYSEWKYRNYGLTIQCFVKCDSVLILITLGNH